VNARKYAPAFITAFAAWISSIAFAGSALAEDGSNEVCPSVSAGADDVREHYDDGGRLVHQLRLQQGRVVEEVAILHRDNHAVARTEITPGHVRIARTVWKDDRVQSAECQLDGVRVGSALYTYRDDRLQSVEKHFWDAPSDAAPGAARTERVESVRFFYDADGQLVGTEVRGNDGKVQSRVLADRDAPKVPIQIALSAGGSYQSDTQLYDANAGLGIHRRPRVHRYGSDPLEVGLDAIFKFHRAAGITSTDQTTLRFGIDYRDILPRTTLFSFATSARNLPANLRLNLEVAVLGIKFDIVPRGQYQLDVSFAPVWNFRSIIAPNVMGTSVDENTSKLRGSLRARAGIYRPTWSLFNTFEFLPTLFGDDVAQENGFWNRTVLRDTVALDINLTQHLTFREEFKYTRDPAMKAQASCPDSGNPLCRGYALASATSLVLNLEL
jgi:hypothetical protein